MPNQSKDTSISNADPSVKDTVDEQAKVEITTTGEPETGLKTSYYLLMVYAAFFGALSSLLAAAYITLYNWGVNFFKQPSQNVLKIGPFSFWPLVLLTVGGVLLGLVIKFFGQHAGLGVAQGQYTKTGRLTPRYVPSIMLEAFITLWSGAAVGPEGPLVFLSGGVGSFIADRLKLEKDDVSVLVYSAIAGGVLIGLIGSFLPLTLYSGQDQLLQIIHNPAAYSVGLLLLMMLVKALLTSTSFATGFDGGPVFPLLFIGGTLGLAISQVLTFIPQGVAVTTGMAGVACAAFPIPLTVALLLGLLGGQPDLLPVITIGAVTGFLISKALTPLLPKRRAQSAGSGEASTT
jgi:H+/Cl- antiporter ClcA